MEEGEGVGKCLSEKRTPEHTDPTHRRRLSPCNTDAACSNCLHYRMCRFPAQSGKCGNTFHGCRHCRCSMASQLRMCHPSAHKQEEVAGEPDTCLQYRSFHCSKALAHRPDKDRLHAGRMAGVAEVVR